MAINDTYSVTWLCVISGDKSYNTVYYRLASVSGPGSNYPQLLAGAFEQDVVPYIQACMSNTVQITRIIVRNLLKHIENPYWKIMGETFGTIAEEVAPIVVNWILERWTSTMSGKHKARTFISGLTKTDAEQSTVGADTPSRAKFEALKDQLLVNLTDSEGNIYEPVLRTTSSGGSALSTPVFTPLSDGKVVLKTRVRRSRLAQRGGPFA